jgi:hypothetical protein
MPLSGTTGRSHTLRRSVSGRDVQLFRPTAVPLVRGLADTVSDTTVFTKKCERLLRSRTRGFVTAVRTLSVTPNVAQNAAHRDSVTDDRTTRQAGYAVGQRLCKRVEQIFG